MRWRDPQAGDGVGLLERVDNFAALRNGLRRIAVGIDEWAGIPMPLDEQNLVIDSRYPNAAKLMAITQKPSEPVPADVKLRNEWWSQRLRSYVLIWEEGGKICHGVVPGIHHLSHDLQTLGCSYAWGIEQEHNALKTLGELLPHHVFKQYLLTGMFLETSKRSKMTYMFRRLKPTVAIDVRNKSKTPRIVAALCLHPIAYYQGSWAGAMTPTDDVIAHLMLMRGDEAMFWRRANQHEPDRPEAGI